MWPANDLLLKVSRKGGRKRGKIVICEPKKVLQVSRKEIY
jgi:hypothetical protein